MVIPVRRFSVALIAIAFSIFGLLDPAVAGSCPAESFVKSAGQAYSDLRSLSLFALGQYRKDLPKSREAEFLSLTRKFIGETLRKHGRGLSGGIVEIIDCDASGSGLTVSTRSASGKKIVFRLAKAGGGYTVRDVNMQGVWLAQQMRSKFTSTISRTGSIDGLFAYLGG